METPAKKRPSEDQEIENSAKKSRKSYPMKFKEKVLEEANVIGLREAARKFSLDPTTLCRWKKSLSATNKTAVTCRMSGGGRPVLDQDMEEDIFSWIKERRNKNWRVTRSMIQNHAKEVSNVTGFSASDGWCTNFLKRFNLSLRRKTHQSQKLSDGLIPKALNFFS